MVGGLVPADAADAFVGTMDSGALVGVLNADPRVGRLGPGADLAVAAQDRMHGAYCVRGFPFRAGQPWTRDERGWTLWLARE